MRLRVREEHPRQGVPVRIDLVGPDHQDPVVFLDNFNDADRQFVTEWLTAVGRQAQPKPKSTFAVHGITGFVVGELFRRAKRWLP